MVNPLKKFLPNIYQTHIHGVKLIVSSEVSKQIDHYRLKLFFTSTRLSGVL